MVVCYPKIKLNPCVLCFCFILYCALYVASILKLYTYIYHLDITLSRLCYYLSESTRGTNTKTMFCSPYIYTYICIHIYTHIHIHTYIYIYEFNKVILCAVSHIVLLRCRLIYECVYINHYSLAVKKCRCKCLSKNKHRTLTHILFNAIHKIQ